MRNSISNKSAFTLVELAIVLIIIGLITGGVVGANSLIESANRQALINEAQQYETAINAFVLEYDEVPGLFTEATDYFGSTYNAIDGTTDNVTNGTSAALSSTLNCYIAWQHLGLSEILPVKVAVLPCNIASSGDIYYLPTASSSENDAWHFSDNNDYTAGGVLDGRNGPVYNKNRSLYLTVSRKSASNHLTAGMINAKNARAIDKKLDDGDPANGSFFTIKGYSGGAYQSGCVDQDADASAETAVSYDLSTDDAHCRPMFFINVNK